jgi:predicted ester cyclase
MTKTRSAAQNETNGNGKAITTLTDHSDMGKLMSPGTERRQSLRGFDPDYVDIVDYIVRCTHKIWDERGVGLIYTHYTHNSKVHTPLGMIYGREEVVAGTIQMLSAFPDRQGIAEDVIWKGNDEDGFRTSHLVFGAGHNTGYTNYGPPTGRKVFYRTIAECAVRENMIYEEWLIRDNMAIVQQLGYDPHEVARKMAQRQATSGMKWEFEVGDIERSIGQTTPIVLPPKTTDGFDVEDFMRRTYHEVWNWRLFNRINENYIENFQCHSAGGREIYGRENYIAFLLSILAMFTNMKLTIDDLYWLGDEEQGYRVAMRWSLVGTHNGYGAYGEPTGKNVYVMVLSQHHIQGGKFVEEYLLFDELALLKHLYMP